MPQGHHTWNLIVSTGRRENGTWGQKWHRFHGTRKEAEQKLTELVGERDTNDFTEPSKLTLGKYLDDWFDVTKPQHAANTNTLYANVITKHLKPALGHIPLQKLQALDIERYYAASTLSPVSMKVQHAVLTCALKAAKRNRTVYQDHGLMFAQAWEHISSKHARLGGALYPQFLNKRLKMLCPDAKVRHIKVHGLRHTCATLSLAAGVPRHIVQERLGHGSENTLSIYSHALPSMQEDAGRRIGTQLFG